MQRIRRFNFLVLLLLPMLVTAQSYRLRLHVVDSASERMVNAIKVPETFADGTAAYSFARQIVPELQEKGYLAASIDSLGVKDGQYDCYVYCGQRYKWAKVSFHALPQALFTAGAFNPAQWENRPLSPKALSNTTEKLLSWFENNGYPFAAVRLDSIELLNEGGIKGVFVLDKGQLRKLDSVAIHGNVRISRNYLLRYLDLQEGKPYNEQQLQRISARLKELQFLQEEKPWNVHFRQHETILNLNLKERPANQVNAIIGLLPNSEQTGKFLLTFDALFALKNMLGYGESISLTVQKLQYRSVTIKGDAVWPYLFNTPVGVEGHFDFYNRDSTFQRSNLQLGGRYQFTASDYLRIFYQHSGSRVNAIDTAFVRANKRLPDNIDVSSDGGGAELILNRTDYRPNPRKGFQVRLSANALLRKFRESDIVADIKDGTGFNYASLYDSLVQNAYQYRINGDLEYYIPIGKRATVKTAYAGGWISGAQLFRNELYQIGGFKLLRGFDEESIFVSQYHVVSLELRLLFNRSSNIYLFSDNGWVQSKYNEQVSEGFYNGFGIGTMLETKTGVFTISYALGRSDTNPIQVRQSKVHFGYVAYF